MIGSRRKRAAHGMVVAGREFTGLAEGKGMCENTAWHEVGWKPGVAQYPWVCCGSNLGRDFAADNEKP